MFIVKHVYKTPVYVKHKVTFSVFASRIYFHCIHWQTHGCVVDHPLATQKNLYRSPLKPIILNDSFCWNISTPKIQFVCLSIDSSVCPPKRLKLHHFLTPTNTDLVSVFMLVRFVDCKANIAQNCGTISKCQSSAACFFILEKAYISNFKECSVYNTALRMRRTVCMKRWVFPTLC